MNEAEELYFNIDTPELIKEIATGHKGSWVLKIPLMTLQAKLALVAKRAIELDDPKLNVLMLEMKLYEVEQSKINSLIKNQKERTKKAIR